MTDKPRSRREFLETAALGTAAMAFPATTVAWAAEQPSAAAAGIRLGVASYSLRELSRADAIAAVNALRAFLHVAVVQVQHDGQLVSADLDGLSDQVCDLVGAALELVGTLRSLNDGRRFGPSQPLQNALHLREEVHVEGADRRRLAGPA